MTKQAVPAKQEPGSWSQLVCGAYLYDGSTRRLMAAAPDGDDAGGSLDVSDRSAKVWDLIERAEQSIEVNRVWAGQRSRLTLSADRQDSAGIPAYHIEMRHMSSPQTPLLLVLVTPLGASDAKTRRDPLTGLYDRSAAMRIAEQWMAPPADGGQSFGLLFVDLDGFKQVNDQHGHATGDQVLRELARRWSRCIRDGDVVARYGGDEFLVLIRGVSGAEEALPIMDRLKTSTWTPISTPKGDFEISITVGLAVHQADRDPATVEKPTTVEDLVAAADESMYAQKRAGRHRD